MSALKSGALILLLAIPFFAYGAWQVRGITHLDMIVSDPPLDKGAPSKEKIAAVKSATEKWEGDIRTLEMVAFQFRQPEASDTVADNDCKNLIKLIAARSADLNDLSVFLSDVGSPKYEGKLKSKYEEWQASKEKLEKAAKEIEKWLVNTPTGIDGAAPASEAVKSFEKLLDNYTKKESQFYDPTKAAAWAVQGRIKVIEALESAAKEPYIKVLNQPLPLPAEADDPNVKKALGAPRAILIQVRELTTVLKNIEDKRLNLPDRVLGEAKDAIKRSSEWAAKEELLALFADREPLKNPAKAGDWFKKVNNEFTRTQSETGRSLIRAKVQQFCAAFIPAAAKLDDVVLIENKEVARKEVIIKYNSDGKEQKLTDSLNELNEFNFKTSFLNFDQITWNKGQQFRGRAEVLQPTQKSQIARDFTQAREVVINWSVKELTHLKMKCEGEDKKVEEKMVRRGLLDKLVGITPPGTPGLLDWTTANSKIWTRLTVLSDAMGKFPALFETGP
jgi:hypothetical protein